eukprot:SM004782S16948  [mRNA]  locus=s4782:584:1052:- [translate_table: standard]
MAAAREEAEINARLAVVLAPPLAVAWGYDDDDDGSSGAGADKAATGEAGSGYDDPMELLPESPGTCLAKLPESTAVGASYRRASLTVCRRLRHAGEREHCRGGDDLLGDWASFLPPLPPDECFGGAS